MVRATDNVLHGISIGITHSGECCWTEIRKLKPAALSEDTEAVEMAMVANVIAALRAGCNRNLRRNPAPTLNEIHIIPRHWRIILRQWIIERNINCNVYEWNGRKINHDSLINRSLNTYVPVNVEIVFGFVPEHRAKVEAAFFHEKLDQLSEAQIKSGM